MVALAFKRRFLKRPIQKIENEYDQAASTYDEKWSSYTKRSIGGALERNQCFFQEIDSSINGGKCNVLDVGSGTGAFAFAIHEQFPHWNMTCFDLSEEMLNQAQTKNWSSRDNVHFVKGSTNNLPFPDNSFDLVTTISSFHFWDDPGVCLSEIRRVLRPNGTFMLTDWCGDFLSCKMCSVVLRARGYSRESWDIPSQNYVGTLLQKAGFGMKLQESYSIKLRMFRIGPRWGMMSFVATPRNMHS
eukprot:CAMPEP_0195290280 /NCGR_PEP_ID=MMETSP0707-20130614/6210_1 /TAXON_ID=33640 /ORGANISM="Asterionellopsis glacialis, Strain CCMP134" /LENGTH=243 /DNA_ID=CAMNT_0040350387 /DNA_START=107 /DNA_END=834 /DNA_ORIENTATION=+